MFVNETEVIEMKDIHIDFDVNELRKRGMKKIGMVQKQVKDTFDYLVKTGNEYWEQQDFPMLNEIYEKSGMKQVHDRFNDTWEKTGIPETYDKINEAFQAAMRDVCNVVPEEMRIWNRLPIFKDIVKPPIPDYDELSVVKIQSRLQEMTLDDLKFTRSYEIAHKNRSTLIKEIDKLLKPEE